MDLTSVVSQRQAQVERAFASALLIAPDTVLQECKWLTPDIITDDRIKKMWAGALAGADVMELSFQVGLQPEILAWVNDTPSSLGSAGYARQIAANSWMNRVGVGIADVARQIAANEPAQAARILRELAEERSGAVPDRTSTEDIHQRFSELVLSGNRTVKTGLAPLDRGAGGLERRTASCWAARPSMGKTALLVQMAKESIRYQRKTALFSLEMSDESIWARMACPTVGVTWQQVLAGQLTDDQTQDLLDASYKLSQQYKDWLLIDDKPQTTESMWQICAHEKFDLVMVDHVRLVRDRDPNGNENKRLGLITMLLKEMAKDLDCHVAYAAQLNRKLEDRADKRPILSDLRDSGEIEENADTVLALYRDEKYNPTPGNKNQAEIWIRKYRDGMPDTMIALYFHPEKQHFAPLEKGKNGNA